MSFAEFLSKASDAMPRAQGPKPCHGIPCATAFLEAEMPSCLPWTQNRSSYYPLSPTLLGLLPTKSLDITRGDKVTKVLLGSNRLEIFTWDHPLARLLAR